MTTTNNNSNDSFFDFDPVTFLGMMGSTDTSQSIPNPSSVWVAPEPENNYPVMPSTSAIQFPPPGEVEDTISIYDYLVEPSTGTLQLVPPPVEGDTVMDPYGGGSDQVDLWDGIDLSQLISDDFDMRGIDENTGDDVVMGNNIVQVQQQQNAWSYVPLPPPPAPFV